MRSLLRVDPSGRETPAVAARALSKRFGHKRILDAIDLTVMPGAVYLLVGPNGSGKTTTLRVLQGLVRPDGGRCEVGGLDAVREGPRIRASIGYIAECHEWGYGWLRIRDMFEAASNYYRVWDRVYAQRLTSQLDLDDARPYSSCSKGEARRVQLILALAHRPPVLLFDEPTDGLDPLARASFLSVLAEHVAATECSVLVSTHLVMEFEGLADHVGVMREGRLALEASVNQLRSRLRRYRAQVPANWAGAPQLAESVVHRESGDRQIDWTIWGVPDEVREVLAQSGARMRDELPVSLHDAAVAFLGRKKERAS